MGFEKFGKFGYVSQTKVASMISYLEKAQLPATRCRRCKTLYFPPRADCQNCLKSAVDWVPIEGRCKLVTFTEVHFAPPQFQAETPYLLGLAELEEGPRVFAPVNSKIEKSVLRQGMHMVLRVVERSGDGFYYELQK